MGRDELSIRPLAWFSRLGLAGLCLASVSGCAMKPAEFAGTRPGFNIQKYYAGHTRSEGFIESRSAAPLKPVTTETWGRMAGRELELTQDVTIGGGKPTRRIWKIRQVDEKRFEATTASVVGIARGEGDGRAFRFAYTLELQPGNFLTRVHLRHWMYLQPDGRTMLNRVSATKAGVQVAQITEVFQRDTPLRE
jgi:hypothetical protein